MRASSRIAAPLPTAWFAALVALTGGLLFAWPGRDWSVLLLVEVGASAILRHQLVEARLDRRGGGREGTDEACHRLVGDQHLDCRERLAGLAKSLTRSADEGE